LRLDPIGADALVEGESGDAEFRSDDPRRAATGREVDGGLHLTPVAGDVAGDGSEMEQPNPHGMSRVTVVDPSSISEANP